MKQVFFTGNSYYRNSGSNNWGIVDGLGIPRMIFNSELFKNNGDAASNSITVYGSGVMSGATSEMSIDGALASPGSYSSTTLLKSVIQVVRSSYFELKYSTFDGNWLLETGYDYYRTQVASVTQFYG